MGPAKVASGASLVLGLNYVAAIVTALAVSDETLTEPSALCLGGESRDR